MRKVTKAKANTVCRRIAKAFGADGSYAPFVRDGRNGWGGTGYQIVWEGPFEWPFLMAGGFDEEFFSMIHPEFEPDRDRAVARSRRKAVEMPEGVWFEPINGYSIALYHTDQA